MKYRLILLIFLIAISYCQGIEYRDNLINSRYNSILENNNHVIVYSSSNILIFDTDESIAEPIQNMSFTQTVQKVWFEDTLMFVEFSESRLPLYKLYNLSDIDNPVVTFSTDIELPSEYLGIFNGNLITRSTNSLEIYSFESYTELERMASVPSDSDILYFYESYIFYNYGDTTHIVDISNPADPFELSYIYPKANNIVIFNNYMVAETDENLALYNIENIESPTFLSSNSDFIDSDTISIINNHVCCIGADNISIYDITTSDSLELITNSDINATQYCCNDSCLITVNSTIINMYSIPSLEPINHIDISTILNYRELYNIQSNNEYIIFTTSTESNLNFVNITDYLAPYIETTYFDYSPKSITFVNEHYVGCPIWRGMVDILDRNNRSNSPILRTMPVDGDRVEYCYFADRYLAIHGIGEHFVILDVNSYPGIDTLLFESDINAVSIDHNDDYVFVSCMENGVRIYDIESFELLSVIDARTTAQDCEIYDNTLFVADGLRIIDITDIRNPVESNFYSSNQSISSFYRKENDLICQNSISEIHCMNITNPEYIYNSFQFDSSRPRTSILSDEDLIAYTAYYTYDSREYRAFLYQIRDNSRCFIREFTNIKKLKVYRNLVFLIDDKTLYVLDYNDDELSTLAILDWASELGWITDFFINGSTLYTADEYTIKEFDISDLLEQE